MKRVFTVGLIAAGLLVSGVSSADGDKAVKQAIKYRQSQMALVGANFKPLMGMVKGKVEFNGDVAKSMAADLAAVSGLNWERGYPEGSAEGKTKAKKEIWKNRDDFSSKMDDFKSAAAKLSEVAAGADKAAVLAQVKELGGTCKACHDDYKAKK